MFNLLTLGFCFHLARALDKSFIVPRLLPSGSSFIDIDDRPNRRAKLRFGPRSWSSIAAKPRTNSPFTAADEWLLRSGRLESRDFDDLAFVRAGMSETDEMTELHRREMTEGSADAERSGELQRVFDVLEA